LQSQDCNQTAVFGQDRGRDGVQAGLSFACGFGDSGGSRRRLVHFSVVSVRGV
jgi:hypothetical protein